MDASTRPRGKVRDLSGCYVSASLSKCRPIGGDPRSSPLRRRCALHRNRQPGPSAARDCFNAA